MKRSRVRLGRLTVIAASIQLIFANAPGALANPTGPQVVSGAASLHRPDSRTLSITNSPGTIINWKGFSIGAGELTRFIQQSPSSTVLNRVVGADISQIHGQLLSNGRVFLINPSGIVIGPGAMIDTAGFVASTLNMLDGDFLAGKLRFQGDASSGSIINQGWIRTGYGGHVLLVAPQIENSGLIHTPGGQILLAAGKKLTVTSLDLDGVQFEVQAPTDSVLNVGKLLADGGAVGVFAGSLQHSGEIRANALVYDQAGRIVLQGQSEVQIAVGSTTSADGKVGGDITVQSASGLTRVAGNVSAQGSAGQGGNIAVLGDRVSIVENAVLNASGSTGGGKILVGGDFQGSNAAVQNAADTFVGSGVSLRADATQSGDGGRIIVWSDDKAQFYGSLSAQGGPDGGNGGFAEVSGKQNLIFAGNADLGAPKGNLGDLLLDPLDLYVFSGGGLIPSITDESTDFQGNAATISPATLAAITGNVTLFASRYMLIKDPINLTTAGQGLTAQVGAYIPPALPNPDNLSNSFTNRLDIGANITTNGGAVTLSAPTIQTVATSTITTAGGAISLSSSGSTIQASQLSLDAGSGAVNVISGSFIQLSAIDGGSFTATAPGFIQIFGPIATTGGPVSLTSSTNSVSTFGGISAAGGNVLLSGTSVSSGTIDTAGGVTLTATNGSISATVNNAASLTATASSTFGTSITINSNTALNAASVSANSSSNFSSVILNASGDINVGTVSATAVPSGSFISESVSINSNGGSIRAMSAASQVTAADVTLTTDQGTGGGIGTAGTALNVNMERNLTFQPNGEFNVVLNGSGPSGLNVQMGTAPAGQNYSGTLSRSGGGLTMSASATDTTVTLNNLSITSGFDQLIFNNNPFITFHVPNGALVANSVTVPVGDTNPPVIGNPTEPLNVSLSAQGNVTVNSYTRMAGGLAKQTSISAFGGGSTVTLGMVDASKDNVSINSGGSTTISSLTTTGNVSISANSVLAQTDAPGLEISAGGALNIQTSQNIGTPGFANPLDVSASSVSMTTFQSGFAIGEASGPVVANTENLTINAAGPFNLSTGSTALKNLTLTANPFGVGAGGLAQVRTEAGQAGDKTYAFASDGSDFTLTFGTVPATQFAGGTFNFTSTSGNINLTGNTNLGTGSLVMLANNGSILNDSSDITAANVTLTANTSIDVDTGAITANAAGGSIALRANTAITTGDLNAPGTISVDSRFCCSSPAVMVGDVGNSTAPQTLDIFGSTVDTGTITGAGDITLAANSGLLNIVGGVVTSVDGSTIDLRSSSGTTPFSFNSIDAGVTGTVRIDSSIGIEQVFGGVGITAQTIDLRAQNGGIHGLDSSSGATHLDLLNGTNPLGLTIDTGGEALFNANSNPISSLTVTKRTIPDVDSIDFIGLAAGQSIAMGGGASDLQTDVTSTSPLNFALSYTAGDITLVGGGIATGGGAVSLTSSGGIDATAAGIASAGGTINLSATGSIDSSGSAITSSGGGVTLTSNTGDLTAGTITSAGGSILARTFAAGGDISLAGNVNAGAGSITLQAFGGGNIAGGGALTSTSSVTAFTADGLIGSPAGLGPAVPLAITSPTVSLIANRGVLATGEEGRVLATLTGTSGLTLSGDRGFEVTSDTAFVNLSVATKGTGVGALSLTAGGGQTYSFARPATDLFGANVANTAFEVVSVNAPTANATFTASDGILLVRGQPGGANKIVAQNVTLAAQNGGDVVLQGKASDPLTLSNTNQTFDATGGATAEVLVRGTVALTATSSQTFSASGNIYVEADAGGGGNIVIAAPTQQFTTTGAASRMDFHGGAAAGEKVTVTATTQQRVDSTSSSIDAFNLVGGSGDDASVTFTHSGTGIQDFQMLAGTVRVEGGSGQNAYAKLEETGTNLQRICRFVIFQGCVPVGGLQILGGSGIGAYGQVTSVGSQDIGVSGATLLRAGTGSGAYALLRAGTNQTIFGGGNLTVEGKGGPGATAKAEVFASGFQSLTVGDILVKGGVSSNSLARIATTGSQFINADDMTLTAGGAGQIVEPFVAVAGASAIIEGHSQNIFFDSMTLNGGAGVAGNTSDALIRNLSGSQSLSGFTATLNGGHTESTTGILNLGTGSQTISASGGIVLRSDPNLPPAHADSFVRIQNLGSDTQSLNGSLTLLNSGAGTVAVTTPGDQTITANSGGVSLNATSTGSTEITAGGDQTIRASFVEVLTAAGSSGNASLSATGDQYIRTTNENLNAESLVVAALGFGTATVQSGASQLLEIGYPLIMQGTNGSGLLAIGRANGVSAAGNSLVQAVDQNVFAGSILVQGPSGSGATSKLSATNTQTISTLLGGMEVVGGAGDNSLATIDPSTQILLSNGSFNVAGGSGGNADGSIVSAGTQTLVNTNGDITLTGGSGAGADAIISSLGAQSITSAGNVDLTGGAGVNTDALISSSTTQFIQAGGDINLIGGPISGSDAIISNIGAQQGCSLLSFLCGAQQTLVAGGSIFLSPGIGLALIEGGQRSNSAGAGAFLTSDATQQTLASLDELLLAFDALAPGTDEPDVGRRVPICR